MALSAIDVASGFGHWRSLLVVDPDGMGRALQPRAFDAVSPSFQRGDRVAVNRIVDRLEMEPVRKPLVMHPWNTDGFGQR